MIVGIDVGGANLKAATTDGRSKSNAYPLWQRPEQLSEAVAELLSPWCLRPGSVSGLAVTMTGELADGFSDRRQGVLAISKAVAGAAERLAVGPVRFYQAAAPHRTVASEQVTVPFCDLASVSQNIDGIASANWHALATWVATEYPGDGFLIDVGSTTTDLIKFGNGQVQTESTTDYDRLVAGELVYVGVGRTPVCGVVSELIVQHDHVNNDRVPVMNEVFATMDDVGLVLGHTRPDADDCRTADGKPRTVAAAVNRLARMVGLDRRQMELGAAGKLAAQVLTEARRRVEFGLRRQGVSSSDHRQWIISGHGSWLLPPPLNAHSNESGVTQLSSRWAPSISRCAPAFAVAQLLQSVRDERRCDAS